MNWDDEIRRALTEAAYHIFYRYRNDVRGTWLEFFNDLQPVDPWIEDSPESETIEEEESNEEDEEPPIEDDEKLRRYGVGYWEKSSGRYIYTTPQSPLFDAILDFLEDKKFLTTIATTDHVQSAYIASVVATANGYDRYADQRLLAGTFRGTFFGTTLKASGLTQIVLMIHFIPGEEYFRVREIQVFYDRENDEDKLALVARAENLAWNSWRVRDGFAAFNTESGTLFLLRGDDAQLGSYNVSDFTFNKKGRRVLAFTATPTSNANDTVRFRFCEKPDEINRALSLLRRLSEEKGPAKGT